MTEYRSDHQTELMPDDMSGDIHTIADARPSLIDSLSAGADAADRIAGRVKWFDPTKGYGFIVDPDGDGDILIHHKLLAPFGHKTLPDGTSVVLLVRCGARGRQGTEILDIDFSSALDPIANGRIPPQGQSSHMPALVDDSQFETVQVRWFNRTKGYGFLLKEDGLTQVFVHMETVRRCGLGSLAPGQLVQAAITEGPRGAYALEIRIHDTAACH